MGRGENVLKKLTMVYIQKGLPLGYTTQVLNFFNSHSFSNVELVHSLTYTNFNLEYWQSNFFSLWLDSAINYSTDIPL